MFIILKFYWLKRAKLNIQTLLNLNQTLPRLIIYFFFGASFLSRLNSDEFFNNIYSLNVLVEQLI